MTSAFLAIFFGKLVMPHHGSLPEDLVHLILQHRAAMALQRRWRRRHHYGHCSRPVWGPLRASLSPGTWRRLVPFARVRMEWRMEPESWLLTSPEEMKAVLLEAEVDLLWGPRWSLEK